jgi:nicotinate-nucleotide adenylyltransferase
MRLGIFGGTFDPPHVGHLIVADDVAAALGLDRVIFVPAGTHPLKGTSVEAPGSIRLEMIAAATDGSELFVVDDREVQRGGPSYTVDTLAEIAAQQPGAELFLLVGSDILAELHRWRQVDEIVELARITVMTRAGVDLDQPPADTLEARRVEVTHVAISSSDVRDRIRMGQPYRYMVPAPVYRIIEENSLYRRRD